MHRRYVASLLVLLALPAASPAQECSPRYYAPSDFAQARPLRQPHADFLKLVSRAEAGSAAAQRSLAVAYESGYLVEKCPAKARDWYRKASAGGDAIAQESFARHVVFERIRNGPECAGNSCPFAQSGEGPQVIELHAGASGTFRVPVTVNGVTAPAIVDTGASFLSMSARQAREMNISYAHGRRATMQTANGTKEALVITVDAVRVGGIIIRDVRTAVSEVDQPLLLGMSFLSRVNLAVTEGRMTLSHPGVFVRAEPPPPEEKPRPL